MQLIAAILLLLQAVISVHTELVAVPVIVTGARGQRVSGLTQETFRVFEDGGQRDIVVFHRGGAAVSLGLIVGRSQSVTVTTSGRGRLHVRTRSGDALEP